MKYVQKCTFCNKIVIYLTNKIHKVSKSWVDSAVEPRNTWCEDCFNAGIFIKESHVYQK